MVATVGSSPLPPLRTQDRGSGSVIGKENVYGGISHGFGTTHGWYTLCSTHLRLKSPSRVARIGISTPNSGARSARSNVGRAGDGTHMWLRVAVVHA
jgi:hypothetical protein